MHGNFCTGTGRAHARSCLIGTGSAPGIRKEEAGDERRWEVGQRGSTREVCEQRRRIKFDGCGGDGGKRTDQREYAKQRNTLRTQGRESVQMSYSAYIKERRRIKKKRFTALLHHVYNIDALKAAYFKIKRNAASGVDKETWQQLRRESGSKIFRIYPAG